MADDRRRRHDGRHALHWAMGAVGALCALCASAASDVARADPLPWTHGARAPADEQIAYRFPPGLKDGRCRPDMFNAAAVHGLVGPGRDMRSASRRRKDNHPTKLDDTAIGILLSAVSDRRPSRGISRGDEICFSQSFEHVPDRTIIAWSSPTPTVRFSVIPMRTLRTRDGRFCREYAAKATVNGHAADVYGTACRQPDGDWYLVD